MFSPTNIHKFKGNKHLQQTNFAQVQIGLGAINMGLGINAKLQNNISNTISQVAFKRMLLDGCE